MTAPPRGALLALCLLIAGCAADAPTMPGAPSTPGVSPPNSASAGASVTPPARTSRPTSTATPPQTADSPLAGTPQATTSGRPQTTPSAPPAGGPARLTWTELETTASPLAREDHTWTVAHDGSSAYLFGGRQAGREFGDLWRYDLQTNEWSELAPEGSAPSPRFGHTAVWAEGIGLVVWSGQQGSRFFADLWAYEPQTNEWRELPSSGAPPAPRYGSCADIGPDGRMWISHGFTADSGRFSDTRAYDFAAGSWSEMTPAGNRPVERCLHDCLWTPAGRLVIYAGQTTGAPAIGDLWSYSPQSEEWSQAPQPEPKARQLYALAGLDRTAFVFGGGDPDGRPLDDLWLLDLERLVWTLGRPAGGPPGPRIGATLIADAARNRLLLFGGKGDDGELADLWQLELSR